MNSPLQPIYLLADSQLLFWREKDHLFLNSVREALVAPAPKAAYIGASNGDNPEFYTIFEAAMAGIGIEECRMIISTYPPADQDFLNQADLILLAGGEVERGWKVFQQAGLREIIFRRYYEGTLLMGVSAGAIQLGAYALIERPDSATELIDTFRLVPFLVGAHEEAGDWENLRKAIRVAKGTVWGIGLPAGSGLVYYPDNTLEAIRQPLHEFRLEGEEMHYSLLFPEGTGGERPETD